MSQITTTRQTEAEDVNLSSLDAKVVEFTLPNSYATGGTPGVSNVLGFRTGSVVAIVPLNHLGYFWEYNPTTDSIKVYQQPAAAAAGASPEVANATNLSGAGIVRALVLANVGAN